MFQEIRQKKIGQEIEQKIGETMEQKIEEKIRPRCNLVITDILVIPVILSS